MQDVVFLTDQLGRGGAETQLTRIAVSLRRRGWKVGILSLFPKNDFEAEIREAGIPHVICETTRLPDDRPLIPFKLTWRLVRQLREWSPSVLITFSYHSDVIGRVCGRLAGVPTIIGSLRTAHTKTPLREKVYRYTEPLIDLTISNSQAGVNYMVSRRILTLRKTKVIPNAMIMANFPSPASREEMRAGLGVQEDTFLWLAVGSLNPAKDYPGLLKAAVVCAAAAPAFRLCIAGGGDALGSLREQAGALGLGAVVQFLGKRDDALDLMRASDAFVLSSAWEGMPNAVMEAMASGLAVVATDVGGIRELIEPGRTGWIVPRSDPAALAARMLATMALEPSARKVLGDEARTSMTSRFDHERITDRWEEQILQAAPEARGGRARHAPAFVISLDFELLWGMRDKQSIATYGDHILGEREAIPAMLKLFRQYGVRATWASVGMTLFDRKEELLRHLPSLFPTYERNALNPYGILGEIGDDERSDPYHYGLSLARQILDCEGMEMGSHTFSHFYCLEKGQTAAQFRADLDASIAITERLAERPVSLVFPRNQYNPEYLSICASAGFTSFRGNETAWMYRGAPEADQRVSGRGARLLDNYLNLSGSNGFIPYEEGGLINCPSSRFLRPFSESLAPFEGLRLRRIQRAMESAARMGRSFHLWWHPHNFGTHLQENLANLEALLRCHVALRDRFGVVPMTMGEVAARARRERAPIVPPSFAHAGSGGR